MGKKKKRFAFNGVFASRDILFIHIPKCGGTSVRDYLRQVIPDWPAIAGQHYRCCDVAKTCDLTQFKMILAVVRDPFARELSQWRFWRHGRRTRREAVKCDDWSLWLDKWAMHHPVMKKWQSVDAYRDGVLKNGYFADYLWIDGDCPSNLKIVKIEEIDAVLPKLLSSYTERGAVEVPRLNIGPKRPDKVWPEEVHKKICNKYQWAYQQLYTDSVADHHSALVTPEIAEAM